MSTTEDCVIKSSSPILTPTEAAEYLRIGRTKIYELLDSKAIRSKRIGRSIRILRSDLEKYLETG